MGMEIVEGEEAVLGGNVRHPIVTNGYSWRSCAKEREAIKLSFGVTNGVGSGIRALNGCPHLPRGRDVSEIFWSIGLNGVFECILNTNVFDSRVKSL